MAADVAWVVSAWSRHSVSSRNTKTMRGFGCKVQGVVCSHASYLPLDIGAFVLFTLTFFPGPPAAEPGAIFRAASVTLEYLPTYGAGKRPFLPGT